MVAGAAAAQVAYSGDSLNVDGRIYSRNPSTGRFVPGQVLAVARDGRAEELAQELERLGLQAKRSGKAVILFLVSVPLGFELQWADALRTIPAVEAAGENTIYSPNGRT